MMSRAANIAEYGATGVIDCLVSGHVAGADREG